MLLTVSGDINPMRSTPAAKNSFSTSINLLRRLRVDESDAWQRFVRVYSPLIYRWVRRAGLQPHDAADILQNVLLAVASNIVEFQTATGHNFCGWLWTITRNQVRLHFRKQAQSFVGVGGSDAQQKFMQIPALFEERDAPNDLEARHRLVHRAMDVVRTDVNSRTWQAFQRQVLNGQSAVDVAKELEMSAAAARQAKYRVLCRIRDELLEW